jgi:hypothetical protein
MITLEQYCLITPSKVSLSDIELFKNDGNKQFSDFLKELYYKMEIDYLKFFKMDNLSKLGFLASEILLKHVKFDQTGDGKNTAILLFNSGSSLESDVNFQETINSSDNFFPSPALFVYTLPNIVIGEICIRNKITGQNVFLVTESFEPDFCITFVKEMFVKAGIDHALVGWVDSFSDKQIALLMFVSNNGKGMEFNVANLENLASYIKNN